MRGGSTIGELVNGFAERSLMPTDECFMPLDGFSTGAFTGSKARERLEVFVGRFRDLRAATVILRLPDIVKNETVVGRFLSS